MMDNFEEELVNSEEVVDEHVLGVRLEYMNSGSDHLRGKTWTYIERSPYAGTIVTPENRRQLILEKALEYKKKNQEAEMDECLEWGKRFVNKEAKHFRKYLKGYNSYGYKGGKFLVEDQSRVEQFKRIAAQMEKEQKEREELENKKEEENNGGQETNG